MPTFDQASIEKAMSTAPADELRDAAKRVLESPDFVVPNRARRLFDYIVNETLSGRSDRIKAFTIATDVLGRDASFDASNDPVVRIEAGRLRRALEQYYQASGSDDPIRITIPRGGYVPKFEQHSSSGDESKRFSAGLRHMLRVESSRWIWLCLLLFSALAIGLATFEFGHPDRQNEAESRFITPQVPRLVVVPFADLSGTPTSAIVARGITDDVIGRIAKFKEIVVVEDEAWDGQTQPPSATRSTGFELRGSVLMEGNHLRLSTRLLDRANGSVIWAESYDEIVRVPAILEAQSRIARVVATEVARPYGIIFNEVASQVTESAPDDWEAYGCTLAYYTYRANLQPITHASVRHCLEQATQRFPRYATAWALLSLTYLDEFRYRHAVSTSAPPPLDLALDAARRAVELDPNNVRGLQAYMTALFFQRNVEAALKVGALALDINPNDTELQAEYGLRLALSGEWERGKNMMLAVIDRNPGSLGYYESVVALCFYMQRDYKSAYGWIRKASLEGNPIYHLIAAAIYGQLGIEKDSATERAWFAKQAPNFLTDLSEIFRARSMGHADELHIREGLQKAGVIPATAEAANAPTLLGTAAN